MKREADGADSIINAGKNGDCSLEIIEEKIELYGCLRESVFTRLLLESVPCAITKLN